MRECESGSTWREVLSDVPGLNALGPDFLVRYGSRPWSPADPDRSAAHLFRVELISRVATQRLGYGQGVEASALTSVHTLFEARPRRHAKQPGGSDGRDPHLARYERSRQTIHGEMAFAE